MDINFEKEIESITIQIIEKYEPEKIILFGSAARGESGSDSDADFLIIKKKPIFTALIESENSAVSSTEISLLTSSSTDLKNSRSGLKWEILS